MATHAGARLFKAVGDEGVGGAPHLPIGAGAQRLGGRCRGDPAFGIDAVAGQLAISRRYVQFLLEDTGTSFVGHLTEQRLARAYAMLVDPRRAHRRIVDIALAAGFGDVSHFNRLFRRCFGHSPSAVRAAAAIDRG